MNRNILWGQIFVDELARSGLKAVCAAPGSRHTPLMLAFAKHPDIKVYSHLDERSAAFFALGLALASDAPVALVCSSGTAGANMYPAIIEAHQSRVPLIVLTADRPAELRHSGANQTIDQIKMFGDYALWFVDMALPEANPPAIAIRNLRSTANRAYAKADGLRKGVVHLNFPFRKPLEPIPVEGDMLAVPEDAEARTNYSDNLVAHTSFWRSRQYAPKFGMNYFPREDMFKRKGILYFGSNSTNNPYKTIAWAARLSAFSGYPIFVECLSELRQMSTQEIKIEDKVYQYIPIAGYENFLQSSIVDPKEIEVVIRFGSPPLSKNMQTFLSKVTPKYHVYGDSSGEWADDTHTVTHYIMDDASEVLAQLMYGEWGAIDEPSSNFEKKHNLNEQFALIEDQSWSVVDHEIENGAYFDGAVVYDVVDLIPNESTLFAGNSLPVRHLDQFGKPQDKRIYTYANRGASGIDGNISTALGTGAARPDKPLVAILGDITFYHDMNGLLAVHRCAVPITIVLINNDGGGIFNRLPISNFEPEFTDYFITPHGLDFSHAAKLYGLDYIQIDARDTDSNPREIFRQKFSEVVGTQQSTIIEVRTDGKFDDARRKEIVAAVHAKLKELDL